MIVLIFTCKTLIFVFNLTQGAFPSVGRNIAGGQGVGGGTEKFAAQHKKIKHEWTYAMRLINLALLGSFELKKTNPNYNCSTNQKRFAENTLKYISKENGIQI